MTLYVVFKGRQQHFTSGKTKVQMTSEGSGNNIKILDILFSEKLQITYTDETHFADCMQARFMHLITEMKPQW